MNPDIPPVLLPAACFPNAGFFSWLLHAPHASIETCETFPKQTCRNRYQISTSQGIMNLIVPVKKPKGNHTPVSEVTIDHSTDWRRNHLRAIESAYNASPFFLYYRDPVEQAIMQANDNLLAFNTGILQLMLNLMRVKAEFSLSQTFVKEPTDFYDMRGLIMTKKPVQAKYHIPFFSEYRQAFSDRQAFQPNLSILDVLFNLGPQTADYLLKHVPVLNHNL